MTTNHHTLEVGQSDTEPLFNNPALLSDACAKFSRLFGIASLNDHSQYLTRQGTRNMIRLAGRIGCADIRLLEDLMRSHGDDAS